MGMSQINDLNASEIPMFAGSIHGCFFPVNPWPWRLRRAGHQTDPATKAAVDPRRVSRNPWDDPTSGRGS